MEKGKEIMEARLSYARIVISNSVDRCHVFPATDVKPCPLLI